MDRNSNSTFSHTETIYCTSMFTRHVMESIMVKD